MPMDDLRDLLTQGVRCKGCGGLTSKRLPTCYRCGRKLDGTEEPLSAQELDTLKKDVVKTQAVAPAAADPGLEKARRILETLARDTFLITGGFVLVLLLFAALVPDTVNWRSIVFLLVCGGGGGFALHWAATRRPKDGD